MRYMATIFECIIFKLIILGHSLLSRVMHQNLTKEQSTLDQVIAWCCQATSHYLNEYWPRFMSQNGVTRPLWVEVEHRLDLNLMTMQILPAVYKTVSVFQKIDNVMTDRNKWLASTWFYVSVNSYKMIKWLMWLSAIDQQLLEKEAGLVEFVGNSLRIMDFSISCHDHCVEIFIIFVSFYLSLSLYI